MTNPNHLTLTAWADYMGWKSAGMAYQAAKEGRVVRAPDGKKVLAAESRDLYLKTADPSKAGVTKRHARERAQATPPADPNPSPSPLDYDYQRAKARREHWAAEREEMLARKEAGELVEVSAHRAAFAAVGASIRAELESWGSTLPPLLTRRDEPDVRLVIAEQVEQVLRLLVDRVAQTLEGH